MTNIQDVPTLKEKEAGDGIHAFALHKLLADLEVHSGYITWRDKTIAFIVLVSEKL